MTSQNSGVSIRSGSSSVSSTSALESGDPGSNPWVGLNLFQNLASKSEGKSGSFECKQPKVGKSYTTSFLIPDQVISFVSTKWKIDLGRKKFKFKSVSLEMYHISLQCKKILGSWNQIFDTFCHVFSSANPRNWEGT